MARKDEVPSEYDGFYSDLQFDLVTHTHVHEMMTHGLNFAQLHGMTVPAAEWEEAIEFHRCGMVNASRTMHWMDRMVKDAAMAPARDALLNSGLLVRGYQVPDEDMIEAVMVRQVRQFVRACDGGMRRLGYARFLTLSEDNAGVALYRAPGGRRTIDAYMPGYLRESA